MGETATVKRTRKPRRNYAKDWQALEAYVRTVIRIKDVSDPEVDGLPGLSPNVMGQIRAYKDILDMMQNGAQK